MVYSLLYKLMMITSILSLGLLSCTLAFTEIYGRYVGVNACQECHKEIVYGWQSSKHARAFDSLKKTRQENLPDCIRCHVVGYDDTGGFIDYELTPELAGVQCEACHGPGARHVRTKGEGAVSQPTPSKKICRRCHTEQQDRNSDFELKVKLVHGDK